MSMSAKKGSITSQTAEGISFDTPADVDAEPVTVPLQVEAGYATYHDDEALRTANARFARSQPQFLSNNFGVRNPVLSSAAADHKYLELVAQLPLDVIANELLDTYFDKANWYFDQPVAKLLEVQTPVARDQLSHRWSQQGAELTMILGYDNTSILSVQHELMRAFLLKNSGHGRAAWHLLGSAIRLAQELGLHIQSHLPQSNGLSVERSLEWLWHDEFTRRLWAKLFTWDSHMALSLGRPLLIRSDDCSIRPPLDCDFPSNPSTVVHGISRPQNQPSSYTAHHFQYVVAQKAHEVVSIGAHKPGFQDYNAVRYFQNQVSSLLSSLPSVRHGASQDANAFHRTVSGQHMLITANSFLLNLHRAHSATQEASRHAAIQAAINILDAQQQLYDLMGDAHYKLFMLSYHSVDAGIYIAVTNAKYPVRDRQTSQKIDISLQQTIQRLSWMSARSSLAQAGGQILHHCIRLKEQAIQNDSPTPIHHSSVPTEQDTPSAQRSSIHDDARATLLGEPLLGPTYADQSHHGLFDVPSLNFDNQDWDRMFAAITDADYAMDTFLDEFSQPPNPLQ
ncbi:hypothetical protein LTR47_011014 [Exophiala xenobiotica]|nr:hypothetical protein LTR41_008136 [Exophiala xenobiotica]KAK5220947.1 hypothetical protein LTR47_011014 [Exophiala xenobiotica]KAK5242503.1 hypothetical protein LTS06_011482 [Exophiala xenobiotica]KAK5348474.1 hypothetical protein LTR61_007934 [Exophiala xenobiotica]KAK5366195.1 hypothetical protein LTR11_008237 [Exophiala xenobiotica]